MNIVETAHDDPRTQRLIALQKAHALKHTPPQFGHAFEAGSDKASNVRFFLALDGALPLGCIGLLSLDESTAEIKTMHVLREMRGRGIGRKLLEHAIEEAKAGGATQLKLETGSNEGFAASRRLYERVGFQHCAPWGAYVGDPFSYCMARSI
ncbi:MAG: GNAT family N-acetyltransferase [Pseudomonadota bacterium]